MSTGTSYVKQSPQEYLQRQSAESVQANQKMEVLDKIRTSNMIFQGQKILHRLSLLRQNLLYGVKESDMPIPDDTIQFDCKTEHHHHPAPVNPLSGLLKIGLGAALAGTGVGAGLAIPSIISGVSDLMKPAAVAPADPKSDAPTVNIGGQEYELSLEPDTE